MEGRFRYLRLGYKARLVAAGLLYAGAAAAQVASSSFFAGVPFAVAAWLLLALKPVSNKPKDQGLEEWRAVSDGEVSRMADNLERSRGLRLSIVGPMVGKVMLLVAFVAVTGFLSLASPKASMALLDLALFAVPGLLFGKVSAHVPRDFDLKASGFIAAMGVRRPEGFVMTPYLRFDKDADGRDVPEDLRLMLEPRRKPADLVGIQIQAAVNKGANGEVPYMYAVVLTRGKDGPAYRAFRTMRARGYEVEAGGDDEYGAVVVRQETSGGGYHTTDDDCEALVSLMVKALEKVEMAA